MENEQARVGTKVTVRAKFLISMWHSEGPRVDGKRVTDALFSIEAFTTTKKPELQQARKLAQELTPTLRLWITKAEAELRETLASATAELEQFELDLPCGMLQTSVTPEQLFDIQIDARQSWPLVNLFLRSFVLMDEITHTLKRLHQLGAIKFGEYKKREKFAAKPLWRCMTRIDETGRNYHKQRKQLALMKDAVPTKPSSGFSRIFQYLSGNP